MEIEFKADSNQIKALAAYAAISEEIIQMCLEGKKTDHLLFQRKAAIRECERCGVKITPGGCSIKHN